MTSKNVRVSRAARSTTTRLRGCFLRGEGVSRLSAARSSCGWASFGQPAVSLPGSCRDEPLPPRPSSCRGLDWVGLWLMWLLPSACSASARASRVSTSGSAEHSVAEWWLVQNATATPQPSSWRGWRRRSWMRVLFGSETSPTWTRELLPGPSAWSARGSLASPGPGAAFNSETQTSGTSGMSWSGSSARWNPTMCAWRTSQASFPGMDSEDSSVPFPRSASTVNGQLYQRRTRLSVPRTTESASSFWATPIARDWKDSADLPLHVPTNGILGRQAPRVVGTRYPHLSGLRLNVAFVEMMLGFPTGWSGCGVSGTPAARRRQRSPSDTYSGGCR